MMKSLNKKQDSYCLFPASAVCILIINIIAICFTIKLIANNGHWPSTAATAYPIQIERTSDFENYVKTSDKLLVVFYTASWCGPCRAMDVPLGRLANKYAETCEFLTVDCDVVAELAAQRGVTSAPLFDFIKNGVLLERFKGVMSEGNLENLILKYLN